jgi:hypothetical protein
MNIFGFISMVLMFIDRLLVPLIFAIAFVVFLWGIYEYFILGGANEEKRKEGGKLAMAGIIGFVIMIAVWGIVGLLVNSLGFDTRGRPPLPTFGGSGGYGSGGQGGGNWGISGQGQGWGFSSNGNGGINVGVRVPVGDGGVNVGGTIPGNGCFLWIFCGSQTNNSPDSSPTEATP